MCKSSLTGGQMPAEYVARAAEWSRELTRFRSRCPGDTDNAMRAVERDYGIDYWTIWRLRYRRQQIRSICASVYARIASAYDCECDRQRAKLSQQIETAAQTLGADHPVVAQAQTVVGAEENPPGNAEGVPQASRREVGLGE